MNTEDNMNSVIEGINKLKEGVKDFVKAYRVTSSNSLNRHYIRH